MTTTRHVDAGIAKLAVVAGDEQAQIHSHVVGRQSLSCPAQWEQKTMRRLNVSADPALKAQHPLARILAGVAAPVWGVAGLTLGLTVLIPGFLVLALSAPLRLIQAPLVLASRSWRDCR